MKIRMLPAGLALAVMMSVSAAAGPVTVMAKDAASGSTQVLSTEKAAEVEPEKEDSQKTETGAQKKPASATANSLVQTPDKNEDSAKDQSTNSATIETYSKEDAPDKSDIGSALGNQDYMFDETDKEAYVVKDGAVLSGPEDGAQKVADVSTYDTIHLTGTNDRTYWEVEYKGEIEYIDKSLITTDKSVIDAMKQKEKEKAQAKIDAEKDRVQTKAELLAQNTSDSREEAQDLIKKVTDQARKEEEEAKKEKIKEQTKKSDWNGPVLSKSAGKIKGPSGNETYYNLNMSGVVNVMRRMGNNDEYWVRDDGCKMLGDYIMCAANLKVHPRGSLVESSLGTCIVCDTGGFASYDSTRLDIATTW